MCGRCQRTSSRVNSQQVEVPGDGLCARRAVVLVCPSRADVSLAPVAGTPDWGHALRFDDVRGEVAIVGIGETAYTKASGRTAREIGAEAVERAIADAGLEPADIDGLTWSGAFADFDAAAFHEHFGTDARPVDLAVGRRHGVGRDRAVPRGAGDPRRARRATS